MSILINALINCFKRSYQIKIIVDQIYSLTNWKCTLQIYLNDLGELA